MVAQEGFDAKKEQDIRRIIGEMSNDVSSASGTSVKDSFISLFGSKPNNKVSEEEVVRLYERYAVARSAKTSFRFEGIISGRVAVTVVKEPVIKTKFKVNVSSSKLIHGDTYDVARIEVAAVDSNDNRIHHFNDCLTITCDGALEVMGASVLPFVGGAAAFYVRTMGGRKQANIKVVTQSMGEFNIPLSVIRKSSKELNISRTEEQTEE